MKQWKVVLMTALIGSFLGVDHSMAHGADANVKTKFGVPVGVVVTLSSGEAQKIGRGERINIPLLPSKFEKPLRNLAAKIKSADKGNGVKVTLTLKIPPRFGIKSKVESR